MVYILVTLNSIVLYHFCKQISKTCLYVTAIAETKQVRQAV